MPYPICINCNRNRCKSTTKGNFYEVCNICISKHICKNCNKMFVWCKCTNPFLHPDLQLIIKRLQRKRSKYIIHTK